MALAVCQYHWSTRELLSSKNQTFIGDFDFVRRFICNFDFVRMFIGDFDFVQRFIGDLYRQLWLRLQVIRPEKDYN